MATQPDPITQAEDAMQTTETKERPILFSGELVRKILSGEKTQTRRVIKPQPGKEWHPYYGLTEIHGHNSDGELDPSIVKGYGFCQPDGSEGHVCPYGKPGDALWVRTDHWRADTKGEYDRIWDAGTRILRFHDVDTTDYNDWFGEKPTGNGDWHTLPAFLMPKWACRLRLRVEDVQVECLQEINAEDCKAEGVDPPLLRTNSTWRNDFRDLWNSINVDRGYGWDANPWVWCLTFSLLGD